MLILVVWNLLVTLIQRFACGKAAVLHVHKPVARYIEIHPHIIFKVCTMMLFHVH